MLKKIDIRYSLGLLFLSSERFSISLRIIVLTESGAPPLTPHPVHNASDNHSESKA